MKIELHLIQSFPPSCLNRDSTGSPKYCDFGGARRARISSQCFKRAMRGYFRENTQIPIGERTKRLREQIVPKLADLQPNELVEPTIDAFIDAYYSKNDSKKPEHSAVLLFLSQAEMDEVADIVRANWDELQKDGAKRAKEQAVKKPAKAGADESESSDEEGVTGDGKYVKLHKPKVDKVIVARLEAAAISSDIALFGRMLAEHTEHKIEGACQVAHAISTNAVTAELDFFSAVDDLNTDDAGAGMLGVTGFNSAVYYRYALIDFKALTENLDGDLETATQTARAFCDAFVEAIPTGKQNSMAAQNLPSLGFFVVRESGAPSNLVNAFCTPAKATKESGLLDESVRKFTNQFVLTSEVYGEEGIVSKSLFCTDGRDYVAKLGTPVSKKAAIDAVIQALPKAT